MKAVASYTHARFEEELKMQLSATNQTSAATGSSRLQDMSCAVIPPIGISVSMVAECDQLAKMLATTFLNPGEPRLSVVTLASLTGPNMKYVLIGIAPGFNRDLSGP